MATDFERLLTTLAEGGIEFVIVGGFAGTIHGSVRATFDLDVVYARSPENLQRIESTLKPHEPHLRGAEPGLPFRLDAPTLKRGLNFTLTTRLGDLDLLGEIAGGGTFESLLPDSRFVELFGRSFRCLDLDRLIATKRAAARRKDLEAVAELEALREESQS